MLKNGILSGLCFAAFLLPSADPNDLSQQMIEAASAGNLSQVRALLSQGAQVNAKNVIGDTALHLAALECRVNVVQYLMSQTGIELQTQDSSGDTPMILAASSGCTDDVKALASHVDLNVKNSTGESALWKAATQGRSDVAAYLVTLPGVDLNSQDTSGISPVWAAAAGGADGYLNIVKSLVAHHANLETAGGYNQRTALAQAAAMGHLEVVKFMVASGANRFAKDGAGLTPAEEVCSEWEGLPPEDGGGDCPQSEILKALGNL